MKNFGNKILAERHMVKRHMVKRHMAKRHLVKTHMMTKHIGFRDKQWSLVKDVPAHITLTKALFRLLTSILGFNQKHIVYSDIAGSQLW